MRTAAYDEGDFYSRPVPSGVLADILARLELGRQRRAQVGKVVLRQKNVGAEHRDEVLAGRVSRPEQLLELVGSLADLLAQFAEAGESIFHGDSSTVGPDVGASGDVSPIVGVAADSPGLGDSARAVGGRSDGVAS